MTPSTVKEFSAPLAPFTWKPPSMSPGLTDGAVIAMLWKLRAFGRRSNSSAVTLCATVVLFGSICGVAPVTFTISVTAPTCNFGENSMLRPSRISTFVVFSLLEAGQFDHDVVTARVEIEDPVRAVGCR